VQKLADNLIGVLLHAESIELFEDSSKRRLDVTDDALGVVLTLQLQAALMFEELFAVELGNCGYGYVQLPLTRQEAGHANPRVRHPGGSFFSVGPAPWACQRCRGRVQEPCARSLTARCGTR